MHWSGHRWWGGYVSPYWYSWIHRLYLIWFHPISKYFFLHSRAQCCHQDYPNGWVFASLRQVFLSWKDERDCQSLVGVVNHRHHREYQWNCWLWYWNLSAYSLRQGWEVGQLWCLLLCPCSIWWVRLWQWKGLHPCQSFLLPNRCCSLVCLTKA